MTLLHSHIVTRSETFAANRKAMEAAIAEAKKILDAGAGNADLNRLIGEDAVRRGDYAAAIPYLEKATQGLPGNGDGRPV